MKQVILDVLEKINTEGGLRVQSTYPSSVYMAEDCPICGGETLTEETYFKFPDENLGIEVFTHEYSCAYGDENCEFYHYNISVIEDRKGDDYYYCTYYYLKNNSTQDDTIKYHLRKLKEYINKLD